MYNAIPGRYANRIGKGQYTIDGVTYKTEKNDGENTLHSGTNNWSYRFWNVTDFTPTSITFSILDKSESSKGMVGDVEASVTYSVVANKWKIKMRAASLTNKTRESFLTCYHHNLPPIFHFGLRAQLVLTPSSPPPNPAHLLQPRRLPQPRHRPNLGPHPFPSLLVSLP